MARLTIAKAGGTSLATPHGFNCVAHHLKETPGVRAMVVSGPGKYTSANDPEGRFSRAAQKSTEVAIEIVHRDAANRPVQAEIDEIAQRFHVLEEGLCIPNDVRVSDQVEPTITAALKARDLARVIATPEILMGPLFTAFLNHAVTSATYLEPHALGLVAHPNGKKKWIITPNAYPAIARTIEEAHSSGRFVVTSGFYAYDSEGRTVLFDRGGTEYTWAVVAAATNAPALNLTDVPGVLAAEPIPNLLPKPMHIPHLTLDEISELTLGNRFGVLQEDAVVLLAAAGLPIHVRNTFDDSPGTLITPTRDTDPSRPVVGVAHRGNFTLIKLRRPGMGDETGIYQRISQVFSAHNISIDDYPPARHRIGILVDANSFDGLREALLDELRQAVNPKEATVIPNVTLVSVVGQDLDTLSGLPERIYRAFRITESPVVASGSLDISHHAAIQNGTLFGSPSQAERVVAALHGEFFGSSPIFRALSIGPGSVYERYVVRSRRFDGEPIGSSVTPNRSECRGI